MMRSTLDEYLDESLDAVGRAEVKRALGSRIRRRADCWHR